MWVMTRNHDKTKIGIGSESRLNDESITSHFEGHRDGYENTEKFKLLRNRGTKY